MLLALIMPRLTSYNQVDICKLLNYNETVCLNVMFRVSCTHKMKQLPPVDKNTT